MNYRQPFSGSYPITQGYGETVTSLFHTGIDYGTPVNTPILASEGGTVKFAGWDNTGYGYCVIVEHEDGNATLYAHLKMTTVKVWQKVARSQVLGYSGNTGNSTGPHLHFEARHVWSKYKTHFDPMDLPLHSSIEPATGEMKPELKGADDLGGNVVVVAPMGAWGWNSNFTRRLAAFPCGQELIFTGRVTKRNEYTYCECYPEPVKYWVAVNDGETQILASEEDE